MKTAMQELIDEMCSINWHLYSFNDKMKVVNVYLEKEKEQIKDAHIEGQRVFDNHTHTQWTNDQAEEYYNQTYNKNK